MVTVSELASKSGTPAHVVRYYTRIGLIEPVCQQENGYRLFKIDEVSRLHFIRMAKSLGFTLNEIRLITQHKAAGKSPCPDVRRLVQQRIEENRQKIEELMNLQARMEQALKQWESIPDSTSDDDQVCHLIESFVGSADSQDEETS